MELTRLSWTPQHFGMETPGWSPTANSMDDCGRRDTIMERDCYQSNFGGRQRTITDGEPAVFIYEERAVVKAPARSSHGNVGMRGGQLVRSATPGF
jgi:hypothetical protein